MPFLSICPYCGGKVMLPDKWLAENIACSRCYKSYLAFPREIKEALPKVSRQTISTGPALTDSSLETTSVAPSVPQPGEKETASPSEPPVPPAEINLLCENFRPIPSKPRREKKRFNKPAEETSPELAVAETMTDVQPSADLSPLPPSVQPASEDEPEWSIDNMPKVLSGTPAKLIPDRVNLFGLMAVILAAVGWSTATLVPVRWPTLLLVALALGLVALGFLVHRHQPRPWDRWWLILGSLAGLVVLIVILSRPQWLHDRWTIDFAVIPPALDQMFLIDPENQKVLKELTKNDWADAEYGVFRHGEVDLCIERVKVAPLAWKEPVSDKPPPARLQITLKIAHAGILQPIEFAGWHGGENLAMLRDNRGNACAPIPGLLTPAEKPKILPPAHFLEELLVFEAPPAGFQSLDLELPASAWGGKGACRFRIPRAMIIFGGPVSQAK